MLLFRSLLFNFFLYLGIIFVFLVALPTLFLPAKFTLLFGKLLGYYVIFLVRIFLNTKVEVKGINNIPKSEKYFVASAHQSMFETFALQAVLDYPVFILKKELLKIPIFGLYLKKIKSIEIVRDTITKDNLNFFDKVALIVNDKCIKCKLMDCVEVCPVDCFYEGENMLVIKPDECIDCGVCEPECPIDAIKPDTEKGASSWVEHNTKYSNSWPNITKKRSEDVPKDQESWRGVENKLNHFSEKSGKGD